MNKVSSVAEDVSTMEELGSMEPVRPYSPECVEGYSLLKNAFGARFSRRLGTRYVGFGAF
jgi:hypothetical protein